MVKNAQSKRGPNRQNKGPAAATRKRRPARRRNNAGSMSTRTFSVPAAMGSMQTTSRPLIASSTSSGDLRVRVRHREYVADITGSVLFAVQQYSINPGLALLFPWLSQLANLFESYLVNGLKFQFRTESASSQPGKAMLAVDWDAADAVPDNKTGMMQERTKADSAVWADFNLICDLADLRKFGQQRFIRQGTAPANTDIKTYDVGTLNVATQGVTSAPVIGELWVEYDIELITPNTAPTPSSAKIVAGGTISNAAVFGTAAVITGPLSVTASASTLTFNTTGQFLVEIFPTGTLSAITSTTGTATEVVVINPVTNGASAVFSLAVTIKNPGETVILSSPTGTVTASTTRIAPYLASLA